MDVSAQTGAEFEEEILRRRARGRKPPFKEFRTALADAIGRQPAKWNPQDPPTPIAHALLNAIKQHLSAEVGNGLKLFVTTDTALDWYHGVDAVVQAGNHTENYVQIDLSIEVHPEKTPRDDVLIITRADIEDEGRFEEVARTIAERLALKNERLRALLRSSP